MSSVIFCWSICLLVMTTRTSHGLGIDRSGDLYPFGEDAGDDEGTFDVDGYWTHNIQTNLPVFDQFVQKITVVENGLLNFGSSLYNSDDNRLITPTDFLAYPSLLFVYWSHWDFSNNGSVWAREVVYGPLLDRATADITSGISRNSDLSINFRATYLFIATYERGIHWGEVDPDQYNTIQVVIASDLVRTFAIMNYGYLTWTQVGSYARVGYDTANQFGYYDHPYERTTNIEYMDSYSNVHVKGRTVFQIDMICDPDTCNADHGVCLEESHCLCEDGYIGRTCDTEANECGTFPCQHGLCQDLIDGYTCTCDDGWEGTNCDINIDHCEGDPCQHGTCQDLVLDYQCHCEPGYTGHDCETDINECLSCPCGFGECSDNIDHWECDCDDGYTDEHCTTNINDCLDNPCEHGVCVDGISHYLCFCYPGFTGSHCETDIDDCFDEPCVHGTCVDHVHDHTCECPSAFTGKDCEIEIDECDAHPCLHGNCFDGIDSYHCECDEGYTGELCEADLLECNSTSCQETGYCHDTIPGYTCNCLRGYTGLMCEIDINECESEPCEHHGECEDLENHYKCHCLPGYIGEHCEININECDSSPCLHGACEDGIDSFHCACDPGYTGRVCETNIDDCMGHPCVHGTCKDQVHRFDCRCYPGYAGRLCEVDIDECHSSPCHSGHCVDAVDGYVCDCPDDVTGEYCTHDARPEVGAWAGWSEWSTCSKLCDGGLQTRYRQCKRPPCLDKNYEGRLCNTVRCHGNPTESEKVAVTLETSKSQQEVVEDEGLLRSVIADSLNSYCSQNRVACCRLIDITVPTGLTDFDTFHKENVTIASGYPLMIDNKVIRIKILAMTSVGELRRSCMGRAKRAVSLLTSTQVIYVPWSVVRDAVSTHLDRINQATCCWSLLSRSPDKTVSYILMGVLIPVGILLVVICVIMVTSPKYFCRHGDRAESDTVTSVSPASPSKWPYFFHYPVYGDRRGKGRVEGYHRGRRY